MNEHIRQNTSHVISKALDRITEVSFYLSGLALLLIIVAYILEVVLRYFFNAPTSFTSDFTQWFLAAMAMLAMPEVTRRGGHVVISFFTEKLSAMHRRRLERALSLAGFIVCMVAVWICAGESLRQYAAGIETAWNHPIPKWWISILIPYGLGITGLQFFRLAFEP